MASNPLTEHSERADHRIAFEEVGVLAMEPNAFKRRHFESWNNRLTQAAMNRIPATLHFAAFFFWPIREHNPLNFLGAEKTTGTSNRPATFLMLLPKLFKQFSNVRVVVDYTEIALGQPNCLQCALRVYSQYDGGFTAIYMVAVTPAGMIAYISECYGGRASDKAIFEQSGLIDALEPISDAIMADRGFLIDEICAHYLIDLIRPPFKKQKKQLSKGEALRTQKIASARVHVERAIQLMKTFKILATKVPWNMVGQLDDILMI
ncbi:uncharacterized protein LOC144126296 [Amblyomma americanum]